MLRIGLFLLTNIAILVVATVVMKILGLNPETVSGLLFMCAFFGFGGALISLLSSKYLAKNATGTVIIENPSNEREVWLVNTVSTLAQLEGIGMPEVGIFPSASPNAFATGHNRDNALVAVSEGLMNNFTPDEIRAVLAHEIGHVSNGDMVTLTLIQGVVNTFVMFIARLIAGVISSANSSDDNNEPVESSGSYFITVMITQLILGFLASAIVMWFSRKREFAADAAGARLAGKSAMIAALERLKNPVAEEEMPKEMVAFGISSGVKENLMTLFMSHPPLEKRIEALRSLNI